MSEHKAQNFTNPDLWIRLIYMIVFALLAVLARWVVTLIALFQFILMLVTGADNQNLRALGDGIARWTQQAYQFLTFAAEQKPYPFQDWPMPFTNLQQPEAAADAAAEAAPVGEPSADTPATNPGADEDSGKAG